MNLVTISVREADGQVYWPGGAGAVYDDGDPALYRFRLWRVWDGAKPPAMFLMLNPSTATHLVLDPTLRRCKGYALAWGFGGFEVCNLFAWRATNPKDMKAAEYPVGPFNNTIIEQRAVEVHARGGIVVAGWGEHGRFQSRGAIVRSLLRGCGVPLHYLKLTQKGEPTHPLYLDKTLQPREWV